MKKYYIGLIVIGVLVLGLGGYVIAQGSSSKHDKQTEKKAQEVAETLDRYISDKQKIPNSLDEAGVRNVPNTISYRKVSESEYEVCVDYKTASTYSYGAGGIISGLIYGRYAGDYQYESSDYGSSSYKPSSLYYYGNHKKGKDCQTAQPYMYGSYYDKSYLQNNYSDNYGSQLGGYDDTERKTDINAMHGQIEAHYAMQGRYPTLANMNDSAWRSINMKGLDSEALRDPEGASTVLVGAPTKKVYSYAPTGASGKTCDNTAIDCTAYTLTATLSTSGSYSKLSLN